MYMDQFFNFHLIDWHMWTKILSDELTLQNAEPTHKKTEMQIWCTNKHILS